MEVVFLYYNMVMRIQVALWKKLGHYWQEILFLLLIKAILLGLIWYFCFSKPLSLSDQNVADHLFFSKSINQTAKN